LSMARSTSEDQNCQRCLFSLVFQYHPGPIAFSNLQSWRVECETRASIDQGGRGSGTEDARDITYPLADE
jgi:hypothetical protein